MAVFAGIVICNYISKFLVIETIAMPTKNQYSFSNMRIDTFVVLTTNRITNIIQIQTVLYL